MSGLHFAGNQQNPASSQFSGGQQRPASSQGIGGQRLPSFLNDPLIAGATSIFLPALLSSFGGSSAKQKQPDTGYASGRGSALRELYKNRQKQSIGGNHPSSALLDGDN